MNDTGFGARLAKLIASLDGARKRLFPDTGEAPPPLKPGEAECTISWGTCGSQEVTTTVAEQSLADIRRVITAVAKAAGAHDARQASYGFLSSSDIRAAELRACSGRERAVEDTLRRAEAGLREAERLMREKRGA